MKNDQQKCENYQFNWLPVGRLRCVLFDLELAAARGVLRLLHFDHGDAKGERSIALGVCTCNMYIVAIIAGADVVHRRNAVRFALVHLPGETAALCDVGHATDAAGQVHERPGHYGLLSGVLLVGKKRK